MLAGLVVADCSLAAIVDGDPDASRKRMDRYGLGGARRCFVSCVSQVADLDFDATLCIGTASGLGVQY